MKIKTAIIMVVAAASLISARPAPAQTKEIPAEEKLVVVWGPSAKLLTEDKELQEYVARIKDEGVDVRACKGCADQYGVSDQLEELGINVLYIGKELTDYIKEGRKMLTF